VNKVIGTIHLSPGRSFQAAQTRIYDLVPYLKNDGNRHDFSHTIHYMYFAADDEADESKAQVSKEMRERMGIYQNPLDDQIARVRGLFCSPQKSNFFLSLWVLLIKQRVRKLDVKSPIHVPLFPQGRVDAIPHPGRPSRQLASIQRHPL
jgi:hypothetical protein